MIANTDGDDPRLAELLMRWEDLHEQGQSLSAEELCSTCPELAEELARRIALLRKLDPLLDDTKSADSDQPRPAPAGGSSRESATAHANFRDLRFHAAGALGEVFMARNAELNREVALKFLKPDRARDADSLRRFLQEAEVTGRLEHPGVVPIYALGTDATGAPCYAMRFIRGETLQDPIDAFHAAEKPGRDPSERSLALRDLLNRFVSICSTMAYAHSRGILHRDLKPRNVMLGKYDETLVVDWGLAKPFDRDEAARSVGEETLTPGSGSGSGSDTPTVGVVGTPAYMSPEQAEARWEIVGPASDIFGLGAILYAILTGRPPYQGRTIGEVLEKVKRCEFPSPRQVKPGVSRALEAISLKATAPQPEERYATALELAADVRRWLADEPVTTYAEPVTVRARRWVRRHRTLVTSTVAALVFGLVVLAVFATVLAGKNRELDSKNVELADKNQELDKQWRRAEERETLAIKAVKNFRDAVQDNPQLRNRSELDSLRKALLKEPLEFFRKLRDQLQAEHGTRPDALEELANASFDLAKTTAEIGSIPDAIRSYSEAVAILERLARENPTISVYQLDLAVSHSNIGILLNATSHPAEALESYRRALEIRERLVRDNPTVTRYQRDLAVSHNNIGLLLSATSHPDDALESHRRALSIQERLARDNPTVTQYQRDLALSHDNIGNLLKYTGHPDDALESLRRALEIQERLARENPTVPQYQRDLALSHNNFGILLGDTGHPDDALKSYRRALEIRERLAGDHPTVTEFQNYLASSHNNIGLLLRDTGHPDDALKSYLRAQTIFERLAHENPFVTEYQNHLAVSHDNIGILLRGTGRMAESLESHRRALAIQERLARENPTVTEYQSDLARNHTNIGLLLNETSHPSESLESFRRALEIQGRLARDHPTVTAYQSGLAWSHNNVGTLLSNKGRWSEALESFRQSLAICERLARDKPSIPDYQSELGVSLHNIAEIEMGQGRWHAAREPLERAIEYQRKALTAMPRHPYYQQALRAHLLNLAKVYQALNQPAEAVQAARELSKLSQGNPGDLYNVACSLALSVPLLQGDQRQALAAEAVQTLQEAITAGWSNAQHTSRNPDLIPLRDRDDFRRLLDELFDRGFPADPFAR